MKISVLVAVCHLVSSALVADGAKAGLRYNRGARHLDSSSYGFYDGDDLYFRPTNDTINPGSIIWSGNGNVRKNETTALGSTSACFSEVATVQVLGVGTTAMKNLRIGDLVLTGKNANYNQYYERVYAFAHQNQQRRIEFITIHMADGNGNNSTTFPLEISPEHLLFMHGETDNPVRADSIQVGDLLRGVGAASPRLVTKLATVQRNGIYAPLTRSGTVVVDGVVASSYVAFQDSSTVQLDLLGGRLSTQLSQHDYSHMGLAPFRLYCGLSRNFCTSYNEDGMPYYVAFAVWITNLVDAQHGIVQLLGLTLFLLVTGSCTILEKMGIPAAAMLTMVLYWTLYCKQSITNKSSKVMSPSSSR